MLSDVTVGCKRNKQYFLFIESDFYTLELSFKSYVWNTGYFLTNPTTLCCMRLMSGGWWWCFWNTLLLWQSFRAYLSSPVLSHCASVQLPWSCKVSAVTTAVLAKQLEEEITAGGGIQRRSCLLYLLLYVLWSMTPQKLACFPAVARGWDATDDVYTCVSVIKVS